MISIVVPALNAANTIVDCIRALQSQNYEKSEFEIIVVDNGSSDDTKKLAQSTGVKVITSEIKGAASARNAGIREANGQIICFTDADCRPTQNWLSQITGRLEAAEVIGCKGAYKTEQTELVARFVQIEYEDKYDLLLTQEYIDFIDTYSAAYQANILKENNGFEEKIHYVEDQELSFRLAARGYKMVFQPEAVVYHLHSATASEYLRKKFMIAYWKSQIIRRFPNKGVRDSHTPQVLKLQMVLLSIAIALSIASIIFLNLIYLAILTFIGFLFSTIPFVIKAWKKDKIVSLSSPILLALRAFALSAGYGWGLLRPPKGINKEDSTI